MRQFKTWIIAEWHPYLENTKSDEGTQRSCMRAGVRSNPIALIAFGWTSKCP